MKESGSVTFTHSYTEINVVNIIFLLDANSHTDIKNNLWVWWVGNKKSVVIHTHINYCFLISNVKTSFSSLHDYSMRDFTEWSIKFYAFMNYTITY